MRIISQDGTIDVPYDYFSLSLASGKYKDVEVAYIYCHNLSSPNGTKLAEYSTKAKAYKAMKMLREAYVGMPMMYKAKDIAEAYKEATEKDLLMMFDSKIDNVFVVKANIFQFPQDDEIEV